MNKIFVILYVFILGGCSLKPFNDTATLSIQFDGSPRREINWTEVFAQSSDRALASAFMFTPHYECVGVNVVGPGIPNSGNGNEDIGARIEGLRAGNSCTYKGILSGFVRTNGPNPVELNLEVPTGPERFVQVAGTALSPQFDCNIETQGSNVPVYEWGRAVTGIFGPTTLAVQAHPDPANSANRKMDCGGSGGGILGSLSGKILWHQAETICAGAAHDSLAPTTWTSVGGDHSCDRLRGYAPVHEFWWK